jgi:hypothetical protein
MAGLLMTSVSSKAGRGLKTELIGTVVSRIVIEILGFYSSEAEFNCLCI